MGKIKKKKLSLIEEQLKLFINSLKNRSIETSGTYERSLREFAKWFKGSKINNIQLLVADVERYKKYLTSHKKLAPLSVSTYLTALRQFYNYLTNNGITTENPTSKVKVYSKPKFHTRATISQKEIELYLNSITKTDERGYRDFAFSKLILSSGLHEIELVRANIGDYKNINSHSVLFVQGKGKKNKDSSVEIQNDVKEALENYLTYRRFALDNEPLFMSAGNRTRGKRMTSRGIRERINMYLKLAGLKKNKNAKISPFSLRHTAARNFASNGMPPDELQKRFRIGKLKTAMLYYSKN